MRGKLSDIDEVVKFLQKEKISVTKRAYGFSIDHEELEGSGKNFIDCGCEHDSSISIAVKTDEIPHIVYFFRFDLHEMAEFIIKSYELAGVNASRNKIVKSMIELNKNYNHEDLEKRLRVWNKKLLRKSRKK